MASSSIHPINLLARADANITTIFHSIFLIDHIINDNNKVSLYNATKSCNHQIVRRIPSQRAKLDIIESGLELFITDAFVKCNKLINNELIEHFGNFVITISDGTRYFANWKGYMNNIIVLISYLPVYSFCNDLFQLLSYEPLERLEPLLLCLCETPVLPICNLKYNVQLTKGIASIQFNNIEQVNHSNDSRIILHLLHPLMILNAWEAIVLERKVLVLSTYTEVLNPICEFLRKITLPLITIHTFVPVLPEQLITSIEAPFPYLFGADLNIIISSGVDLTESVVIDLDSRQVFLPSNKQTYPDVKLPDNLRYRILNDINNILYSSVIDKSVNNYDIYISKIIQIFMETNQSLLCARSCRVKAFFRVPKDSNGSPDSRYNSKIPSSIKRNGNTLSTMGFEKKSNLVFGFMQLLLERNALDSIHHFLPCWLELDDIACSIYEHADYLPLLYLQLKDIESVSPSIYEPEGHVFEIKMKVNGVSYCLTATDNESRRLWIDTIEEKMKDLFVNKQINMTPNASNASNSFLSTSFTNTSFTNPSFVNSNSNEDFTHNNEMNSSHHSQSINTITKSIGFQSNYQSDDTNELQYSYFRSLFMKTQMISYLHSQIEFSQFSILLKTVGINMNLFIENPDSTSSNINDYLDRILLREFLWKGGTIINILERIQKSNVIEYFQSYIPITNSNSNTSQESIERNDTIKLNKNYHSDIQIISKTPVDKRRHRNLAEFMSSSLSEKSIKPMTINTKSRSSNSRYFSSIFSSRSKTDKSESDDEDDEETKEEQAKLLKEKEDLEHKIKLIKDYIKDIVISRQRCDSELCKRLIEDRMQILADILNSYSEYNIDSHVINIPIADVLNKSNPLSARSTTTTVEDTIAEDEHNPETWYKYLWNGLLTSHYDRISRCKINAVTNGLSNDLKIDTSFGNFKGQKNEISLGLSDVYDQQEYCNIETNETIALQSKLVDKLVDQVAFISFKSDPSVKPLIPVYNVLIGYLYQNLGKVDKALDNYSEGCLIDQKHLMLCLARKFKYIIQFNSRGSGRSRDRCTPEDIFLFIRTSFAQSPIIGLQAYRLATELLHIDAMIHLSELNPISLGGRNSTSPNKILTLAENHIKRGSLDYIDSPEFSWSDNDNKKDILNEAFICTTTEENVNACDLSYKLLCTLREMLKTFSSSPGYRDQVRSLGGRNIEFRINPGMLEGLRTSSAFKTFEIQTSQFQKINLSQLLFNERLLFFINIYNMITIHGLIVKSNPGKSLLERSTFMRSCKYNLNGQLFSLLDIEHGILRNKSAKPLVFGSLTYSISFSDRDPRKVLALDEPRPLISFCLFTACISSPILIPLKYVDTIDEELINCTKLYIQRLVKVIIKDNIKYIELPKLFEIYSNDFGNNNIRILEYVISLLSEHSIELIEEIRIKIINNHKSHVIFAELDWTPAVII